MNPLFFFPTENSSISASLTIIGVDDGMPLPSVTHEKGGAVEVAWQPTRTIGGRRIAIGHVRLAGLEPDHEYSLTLSQDKKAIARVRTRTLPIDLFAHDRKLIVILGSCYCRFAKQARLASDLYRSMVTAHGLPHFKVWAGDQVYLDSPWDKFMFRGPHTTAEVSDNHWLHYANTWSSEYLGEPLANGANYFVPDDHEFWNNSPFPNAVVPELYKNDQRLHWAREAEALLNLFQPVYAMPVAIPPLSILFLDTRSSRALDFTSLMKAEDHRRLADWANSLRGPGLLVVGQPILDEKGKTWWKPATAEDYGYADFDDYAAILAALRFAKHDVAVLTGDVHFSRVSRMQFSDSRTVFEVIASPLALVVGLKRAKWRPAPSRLESTAGGEWAVRRPITEKGFQSNADCAVAIEVTRQGLGVKMEVHLWELSRAAAAKGARGQAVFEFELH
jgi:hypothetical protein